MLTGASGRQNLYYSIVLPLSMAWFATIFLYQLLDYFREDAGSEDNEPEAGVNDETT